MHDQDSESLATEFDALMAANGVVVPPERKAGAVASYADHKRMTTLIRGPRTEQSEPASTYSIAAILRRVASRA